MLLMGMSANTLLAVVFLLATHCELSLAVGCNGPKCLQREVRDKTPTPCKTDYPADFIAEAAAPYVESYRCGHEEPRLLLLFGGSGAGKGTFLRHLETHGFNISSYAIHGLDKYLDSLPEYLKTVASESYVYKDAADACYSGAIKIAKRVQVGLLENRCNVVYEETGKDKKRVLERVLSPFRNAGFKVTLALVDNVPSVAQDRAHSRFLREGRYGSTTYIASTFENVFENYQDIRVMSEYVDSAVYCNNHCEPNDTTSYLCMTCWDDSAIRTERKASGGTTLTVAELPEAAFAVGATQYLSRDVGQSDKQEL